MSARAPSTRGSGVCGSAAPRGYDPVLCGEKPPHSTPLFCGCRSGLEMEEKSSSPGNASGSSETAGPTRTPAAGSPQECRCLGLQGVDRRPPRQTLPRRGTLTLHSPEGLAWARSPASRTLPGTPLPRAPLSYATFPSPLTHSGIQIPDIQEQNV